MNAWDYTYGFFKTSVDEMIADKKRMVVGFATAISLSLGGKQEDWDKFLAESE